MDTLVAPITTARMTVAEFLTWEPADGGRYQLIDGVPHFMAPTNRTHGALHGEVAALLRNHPHASGSPCSVIIVSAAMAAINMRIPDIGVTCTPYVDEETALSNPVVLIEILSRSNVADTWSNVWSYTTIPSARDILICTAPRSTPYS